MLFCTYSWDINGKIAIIDRDEAIMLKNLLIILFRNSLNVYLLFSIISPIIPTKKNIIPHNIHVHVYTYNMAEIT